MNIVWLRLVMMLAIITFLLVCRAVAAEVRGVVLDEGDSPLEGASVVLTSLSDNKLRFSAATDRHGVFQFSNVPFGNYAIEAALNGFISVRYHPLSIRYLRLTWKFRLPLAEGSEGGIYSMAEIIGTLKVEEQRVAGGSVCLSGRGITRCTTANGLGEYHLQVEPGRYTAVVRQDNRVIWQQILDLPSVGEYRDQLRP